MSASDRIAFVDLQGFVVNKCFVLKEVSFSIIQDNGFQSFDDITSYHYIFAAPFPWKYLSDICKKRTAWLTAFHHGFYWCQGTTAYEDIITCIAPLLEKDLIIYVKGEQKVSWLRELCYNPFLDCRNIETIGCNIRLGDVCRSYPNTFHCKKHSKSNLCALQNVEVIKHWYYTQHYGKQTSGRE